MSKCIYSNKQFATPVRSVEEILGMISPSHYLLGTHETDKYIIEVFYMDKQKLYITVYHDVSNPSNISFEWTNNQGDWNSISNPQLVSDLLEDADKITKDGI